ncbi:hypothetical protein [Sinomonas albida]|uniref:hypothetical protein n=1 Tax=Sinomonas albida TaxID=369942 RepID=UPI0010A80AC7|nr:hypothetical protein [Sinomonas albida]
MSNSQYQSDQNPWPPAQAQWPSSVPWAAAPPSPFHQGAAPLGLSPQNAVRSRKWRMQVGWISIVLAIFNFAAAMLFSLALASNYAGRYADMIGGSSVVVSVIAGAVYLGLAIWCLATTRTTAVLPLVFSLAFNGLVFLISIAGLVGAISRGGSPQVIGLILELWVIQRSILVLRMKPIQAAYGAVIR